MSDAKIIEIAKDVLADLAAGSWSQSFTPQRGYTPIYQLTDTGSLHVYAIPKGFENAGRADRAAWQYGLDCDVAVMKRFAGAPALSDLDPLMLLVQEIERFFRGRELNTSKAACVASKNEPVWVPEHLLKWQQFSSVLTLGFRWHG
jgi:hypothetical protein